VTDEGLKSLAGLTRLETLNLRYTKVTTPGLRHLKGLTGIKRLWTDGLQFSDKIPDRQWQVWLASAYGDDIYAYELGSFKLLKRFAVGPNPHGLSASADGRTVHVALEHFRDPKGELAWVDTKTFAVTGRVEIGPQPNEQECTPDGKWIYIPCADGKWYVVDGQQKKVARTIETGGRPHNTVVSPDGKRMYLSPMGYPHAVSVVDIDKGHQIIGEIPFKDVTRPPAISSDERLFFQNIDNMLGFQVADIGRRQVVKTIEHFIPTERRGETSRSHGLGVRPDQQEIWTCNVEHHLVHVHEMTSGEYNQISTITLPGSVYWLSFSPDSKYCFISLRSNGQVAVIDCVSKNIVAMLDGGLAVKRTQVIGVPLE
jgi:DNA-binding beta-propeller fold protein YncE